jgi:hypothetical protein
MFCFPFVYHACTRDIRVTGLKNKYFIQFFFIFYFLFLKAITEKGVVTIRRKQKQPQNTTQHSHFYFLFFIFYWRWKPNRPENNNTLCSTEEI